MTGLSFTLSQQKVFCTYGSSQFLPFLRAENTVKGTLGHESWHMIEILTHIFKANVVYGTLLRVLFH
jgi:hypothetical protein